MNSDSFFFPYMNYPLVPAAGPQSFGTKMKLLQPLGLIAVPKEATMRSVRKNVSVAVDNP